MQQENKKFCSIIMYVIALTYCFRIEMEIKYDDDDDDANRPFINL